MDTDNEFMMGNNDIAKSVIDTKKQRQSKC